MLFYVIISVFVSDIMNFNGIKSPKELYDFMEDNINYGVNINNKIYTWDLDGEFQNICRDEWRLKSSEDIINSHYGICFDQVEIEREIQDAEQQAMIDSSETDGEGPVSLLNIGTKDSEDFSTTSSKAQLITEPQNDTQPVAAVTQEATDGDQ